MLIVRDIKRLVVSLIMAALMLSCGVAKLEDQVEIGGIESISLKGLTALELTISMRNDSRYKLEMSRAEIELFVGESRIMTLEQVGEAVSEPKSSGSVRSLWRIGGIDPMTMLSYSGRIMNRDFSGMSINYSAHLKGGGVWKNIEGEGVELSKFMTMFDR